MIEEAFKVWWEEAKTLGEFRGCTMAAAKAAFLAGVGVERQKDSIALSAGLVEAGADPEKPKRKRKEKTDGTEA